MYVDRMKNNEDVKIDMQSIIPEKYHAKDAFGCPYICIDKLEIS